MSKVNYNALSDTLEGNALTQEWLKKRAPSVYMYGPTGVGKTHLLGTLLSHTIADKTQPYAPVLYIDADQGCETVAKFARNPKLCTLREFDEHPDEILPWMYNELDAAERTECGAVIIEGLTAVFKSLLAPIVRNMPSADGSALWGAYKEPSMRLDNLFEYIKRIKQIRRSKGTGIPVFVTLNVNEINENPNDSQSPKMFTPTLSKNRTLSCMRSCDAFIELKRGPNGTQLLPTQTPTRPARKLRNQSVSNALGRTFNLTLPGMLTLWASVAAEEAAKVQKSLAPST